MDVNPKVICALIADVEEDARQAKASLEKAEVLLKYLRRRLEKLEDQLDHEVGPALLT